MSLVPSRLKARSGSSLTAALESDCQALQGFAVPDGEDKGTKWKTYAA